MEIILTLWLLGFGALALISLPHTDLEVERAYAAARNLPTALVTHLERLRARKG